MRLMKKATLKSFALGAVVAAAFATAAHTTALAQQAAPTPAATRQRVVTQNPEGVDKVPEQKDEAKQSAPPQPQQAGPPAIPPSSPAERLDQDDVNTMRSDIPPDTQRARREQNSEEIAAVLPYYNNFLSTYRLGPEDVISVLIFGQERYSKAAITVPPTGVISYPLIPEGIFVAGKTTEELQEEIRKRMDEYIIDPKVSVTLERPGSARYSVLGDVGAPGVKPMTRRLSVYEAVTEAGGVLPTGNKSKVHILRQRPDGTLYPIKVNIHDIEKGKAREMAYLVPGDQVIVPGNFFKKVQTVLGYTSLLSFSYLFRRGGGLY